MGDHPGVPEDVWSYLDRIDEVMRDRMAYIEEQIRAGADLAVQSLLDFDVEMHGREQQLQEYWRIRHTK